MQYPITENKVKIWRQKLDSYDCNNPGNESNIPALMDQLLNYLSIVHNLGNAADKVENDADILSNANN